MNRLPAYAITVATAALTLTGCTAPMDTSSNPTKDNAAALARLKTLPTSEDTEAKLNDAIVQLGQYITSLVPGMQWEWAYERSTGGCAPRFADTGGREVYLRKYGGSRPIPDTVWPQVVQRAGELAASVGATQSQTFQNKPGNHEIRFYSEEDTSLQVATEVEAVIAGNTGCRLPRDTPRDNVG